MRKEIQNAEKAKTPESCFTYSVRLKPILPQVTEANSKVKKREKDREMLFLTGKNAERRAIQIRAEKVSKKRRKTEKRKSKEVKRAAKKSTAKFFTTELRQTDIRQFFKAKAKIEEGDKKLIKRVEAAPTHMSTQTAQQHKTPPTTTTTQPLTTTTTKTPTTPTTEPPTATITSIQLSTYTPTKWAKPAIPPSYLMDESSYAIPSAYMQNGNSYWAKATSPLPPLDTPPLAQITISPTTTPVALPTLPITN